MFYAHVLCTLPRSPRTHMTFVVPIPPTTYVQPRVHHYPIVVPTPPTTYPKICMFFKNICFISYDTKGAPTVCCTNTDNDIRTTTCRAVPKRFWRSPTTPKEPPTGCCTNTNDDMCTNYGRTYMYSIKLCSVI